MFYGKDLNLASPTLIFAKLYAFDKQLVSYYIGEPSDTLEVIHTMKGKKLTFMYKPTGKKEHSLRAVVDGTEADLEVYEMIGIK